LAQTGGPTEADAPIAAAEAPTEAETPTEALGDEIARLSAHLNAATYQLLVLIRAFDEREGWANGFLSCAHWLAWRTGISARPAREKVRVARALAPLARISQAMANGTLSYSKVRALTRVATPDNEEDLLDVARHATAAQLEKLVRAWKRVEALNDPENEEQRHQNRFLRLHQDDDGSYRIQGRLDPEVGALLEKALEWANEALYQEDSETCFQHRMADGLGLVAERALAGEGAVGTDRALAVDGPPSVGTPKEKSRPVSRAERFQVVVHVGAEELRARGGSEVEGGSAEPQRREGSSGPRLPVVLNTPGTLAFLPPEASRRLSCDAGLVVMTHDRDGRVLDVGRKSRTVPPSLRRALDVRDQGCRFPGCECRYTEAHHIEHWANGGETKLDNLLLLCSRHHRALHEGGFQVRRLSGEGGAPLGAPADGDDVQFFSPGGEVIPAVPEDPPIQGDAVDKGDPFAQAESVREIVARNEEAGIVPDAWTATPLWNGGPLDLSLAVDMFLGLGEG
jgi:hypothetical protein